MKKFFLLPQLLSVLVLLSSCKIINNEDKPLNETEENVNQKSEEKKERMEIRFSCGEDGISKYTNNGWNIVEEFSEEKVCTWKSFPATKGCDMEKDKGCKITKPDKIGKEKIYLLEK